MSVMGSGAGLVFPPHRRDLGGGSVWAWSSRPTAERSVVGASPGVALPLSVGSGSISIWYAPTPTTWPRSGSRCAIRSPTSASFDADRGRHVCPPGRCPPGAVRACLQCRVDLVIGVVDRLLPRNDGP